MDLVKELKKQADGILKDEKKKEQAGDVVEGLLKESKKHITRCCHRPGLAEPNRLYWRPGRGEHQPAADRHAEQRRALHQGL